MDGWSIVLGHQAFVRLFLAGRDSSVLVTGQVIFANIHVLDHGTESGRAEIAFSKIPG